VHAAGREGGYAGGRGGGAALPGARRLDIAAQLSAGVRAMAEAGLRHRHPEASGEEIRCRGGSPASSFQGEPRATNDIDLVVDLTEPDVGPFVAALGPDFDVDQVALRQAVRDRASWNIVHVPAVTTIDPFRRQAGPFDASEFARRQRVEVRAGQSLFVESAGDTVLRKLLRYRAGGGPAPADQGAGSPSARESSRCCASQEA